jgi:hypothetical protein
LDQLGNSLICLAIVMNHEDCQFQVSELELRSKVRRGQGGDSLSL